MNLVWKLLRRHISVPQFVGFFFANLLGMMIVLLGYQFYCDVLPVFTQGDSFMKADYLIVSKRINMGHTLSGTSGTFTESEVDDLQAQPFARRIAPFTLAEYRINAYMSVNGTQVLSSELFIESVPDSFIDVNLHDWDWQEGSSEVPVILPRTYINMYNFGFAQSRSLPKISDGLVGMIDLRMIVRGDQNASNEFRGRVVGFSSRLNSILVPQAFMDWSNRTYSPNRHERPSRLILEVGNPVDEHIAEYLEANGYEVEDDDLNAEKTTYFLKMLVAVVMTIGLLISLLSFYILMLSIYLLVQKNSSKLENLLLIGYSSMQVARPYQILTLLLGVSVLIMALGIVILLRSYYMEIVETLYPDLDDGSLLPAAMLGVALLLVVSFFNMLAIYRKIIKINK